MGEFTPDLEHLYECRFSVRCFVGVTIVGIEIHVKSIWDVTWKVRWRGATSSIWSSLDREACTDGCTSARSAK